MGDGFAPFGGAVDEEDGVAEFDGFESGALNAGALDELGGIDETAEIEASADAEEGAHFGGELLLTVDPGGVGGGSERIDGLLAEFGLTASADDLAEALELKGNGAGVEEWSGHDNQGFKVSRFQS